MPGDPRASASSLWAALWATLCCVLVAVGVQASAAARERLAAEMAQFHKPYERCIGAFAASLASIAVAGALGQSNVLDLTITSAKRINLIYLLAYTIHRYHFAPTYLNTQYNIHLSTIESLTHIMIQIPLFTVLDSITFHAASCGIAVTTIGPPKPRTRYSLRILFLKATMLLTSVVAHVSVFSLRDDDILQSCRLFAMIGITFLNTSNIWWMYANWKIGMRTTVCKVALISCAWNVRYAFVLSDTLSIPYTVVEYLTIYSDVCIMTILSLAVVCTHLAMSPLSSSSSSSSSSSLPPHAENNKQTIQSNFKNLSSITTPKDALGALVVYLKLLNLEYLKKEITAPLLVMGVELLQAELNIILAKLVPQTKFVLHSKLNVTLGNSNKLLIASDSISFEFMGSKEEAKMLTLDLLDTLKIFQLQSGHRFKARIAVHEAADLKKSMHFARQMVHPKYVESKNSHHSWIMDTNNTKHDF